MFSCEKQYLWLIDFLNWLDWHTVDQVWSVSKFYEYVPIFYSVRHCYFFLLDVYCCYFTYLMCYVDTGFIFSRGMTLTAIIFLLPYCSMWFLFNCSSARPFVNRLTLLQSMSFSFCSLELVFLISPIFFSCSSYHFDRNSWLSSKETTLISSSPTLQSFSSTLHNLSPHCRSCCWFHQPCFLLMQGSTLHLLKWVRCHFRPTFLY